MTTLRSSLLLALLVLVSACTSATPPPTAVPTQDTKALATEIAANIFATQTASAPTLTNTTVSTIPPTGTSTPTETPTATETEPPTYTPTSTATNIPKPTARPMSLSGNPADWIPSGDAIPDSLVLYKLYEVTNDDAAQQYTNQPDVLARILEWGRVTGYYKEYVAADGCKRKSGIGWLRFESVLMKSASGARQYEDWLFTVRGPRVTQISRISGIGDAGHGAILWLNDTSGCTPPDNYREVRISFARYNVIGSVDIAAFAGTVSEADMQATAMKVAEAFDSDVLGNAR